MNVRHPEGVLHSFSIKNISYDKMDLRLFFILMWRCFLYFVKCTQNNFSQFQQFRWHFQKLPIWAQVFKILFKRP